RYRCVTRTVIVLLVDYRDARVVFIRQGGEGADIDRRRVLEHDRQDSTVPAEIKRLEGIRERTNVEAIGRGNKRRVTWRLVFVVHRNAITGVKVQPGRFMSRPPVHEFQTPQRRREGVARSLRASIEV